ncbi:uncharacterized protein LOC112568366 [Pomacea canaliculata]|uniref:uncharacterized protein LOC112568366 n=1 Tax=Pomacea canaliculata TaxID=400727 RepID=UPI000D727715|nr:uncharacterized protein LOC112568366 [Pomacea canaliculata]
MQQAAVARRKELQRLCDRMLYRKAEWESLLGETKTYRTFVTEEKEKTLSTIKQITEEIARAVQEKGEELAREAEKLFAGEQERWSRREDEVKRALSMAQEAYSASDDVVMTSDNNNVLLRQFGKLRGRCDAVMEIEISDVSEILNHVEVKSKWLQELATNDVMELNAERSIPVKKIQPLSERSLETFRRISRKKVKIF